MRRATWWQLAALPLLLLVVALARTCSAANENTHWMAGEWAQVDYSIYHTKDQVFEEVEQVVAANQKIMRIDEVAAPEERTPSTPAYASPLKVVTVEPAGLSSNHAKKLRLLLNYGEHGRELITVEVALRLLAALADPGPAIERSVQRGHSPHLLKNLLHSAVFKIIPMENEVGRAAVERGQLCERKNGRGVDTNRNWEVHWGFKEKDYDPKEEFPGTRPFSEPETAAMLKVAQHFKPHVWMNAHSGMEALFMPYDHLAHIPEGIAAMATQEVLQQLNNISCGGRCAVGSGGAAVGYLAHGTATDYMYERLGVPLSFTWEIYGDTKAHFNDCFRMFNPVTQAQFDEVVGNWTDAIFAMMELLPGHPSLPQLRAHAALGGRRINPGAGRTLDSKSGGRSPLGPAGQGGGGSSASASVAAHASAKGALVGLSESPSRAPWAMGGLAAVSFVAGVVVSRTPLCAGLLRVGRRRRLSG